LLLLVGLIFLALICQIALDLLESLHACTNHYNSPMNRDLVSDSTSAPRSWREFASLESSFGPAIHALLVC
jgi:hypothetical protein